jgi:hypothetical protein
MAMCGKRDDLEDFGIVEVGALGLEEGDAKPNAEKRADPSPAKERPCPG